MILNTTVAFKSKGKKPTVLIFSLLLMVIVAVISGFNSNQIKLNTSQFDYIQYTRLINHAERFVLDSNYVEALHKYEKAFGSVDKPLANHCFTAMQVSACLNRIEDFKFFMDKGFQSGLAPEYITVDELLQSFIAKNKLDDYVIQSYDSNRKEYLERIDTTLRDTVQKLVMWDMRWKRKYLDSLPRVDPDQADMYVKKYDSIISNIVENYAIPLIEEKGWPGERLIGIAMNGQYPRNSFANATMRLLLWHYHTPKTAKPCEYNDLFYREVLKGNMTPSTYASILDFQARKELEESCENVVIYDEHYILTDTTRFKEFNSRRMKLGLESIEERNLKYKRGQRVCKEIRNGNNSHIKLFYWCG